MRGSSGLMADAIEALRVAVASTRQLEMYLDWQRGGAKYTGVQNVRVDLTNLHMKLIELANLPDETQMEEHNVL